MASTGLTQTFTGTQTDGKKGTLSWWMKRTKLGTAQQIGMQCNDAGGTAGAYFDTSDRFVWYGAYDGSWDWFRTDRLFRDMSAWYHIVINWDTTLASAGDRMQMFVNGVRETQFESIQEPAQDVVLEFGTAIAHQFNVWNSGSYFDGLMSYYYFIDGTAYPPTTFGAFDSTDGIWKIETTPSVTYGNQGFLILKDGNTITDQSTNSHDWTLATGNLLSTKDSPSNNFPSWNSQWYIASDAPTFSNINNQFDSTGNSSVLWANSTLAAEGGKWYAEFRIDTNDKRSILGISQFGQYLSQAFADQTSPGGFDNSVGYMVQDGDMIIGPSSTTSSYGTGPAAEEDIYGMAWDMDNKRIYFSINGTWQNSADPSNGTGYFDYSALTGGGPWGVIIGDESGGYNDHWRANWGNGYFGTTAVSSANADGAGIGAFEYTVPTGFYALCTKNIYTYGG